jgi:glycosyltransferase involved in cell wall biosynthesis
MTAPELSVIVPTFDRPAKLERCMQALERQRDGCPALEIVVVDDGSSASGAVAAAAAEARLVRCAHGGIAAARNSGVNAARAPFLCFTDDDCEPAPGWAARMLERLREGADVVAGPTRNGRPGDSFAAASQLASNALVGRAGRFAPGSNLGCRREIALALPFDERYAGVGAEDRDWYERVVANGYDVVFERDAVVLHFPDLTLREFWRKHLRYGRGAYRYRRMHRAGRLEPPGFYARLLGAGFRAGIATGVLVCVAELATASGFAREALAAAR